MLLEKKLLYKKGKINKQKRASKQKLNKKENVTIGFRAVVMITSWSHWSFIAVTMSSIMVVMEMLERDVLHDHWASQSRCTSTRPQWTCYRTYRMSFGIFSVQQFLLIFFYLSKLTKLNFPAIFSCFILLQRYTQKRIIS